jgi:PilZ domain
MMMPFAAGLGPSRSSRQEWKTGKLERRKSRRFPIELELVYETLDGDWTTTASGSGKTINMSSSGLLFACQENAASGRIEVGRRLEARLKWPVRLRHESSLSLVVRGRVVRRTGAQIALEIQEYEFRTRK